MILTLKKVSNVSFFSTLIERERELETIKQERNSATGRPLPGSNRPYGYFKRRYIQFLLQTLLRIG